MQLLPPCPCGSGSSYDACCGRFHRGDALPSTPEELMRSRYAAYAVGELDYVFRTWHPRTRPDEITPAPGVTWTELAIVDVEGDIVEFQAHFRSASGPGVLHERSRFERRRDRWVYVESVG